MDMKPSAYRSMHLARKNKTKVNDGKLRIWINEKWVNLNAIKDLGIILPCGKKYENQKEPTVCRPLYDMTTRYHKTPKPLALDLSNEQIKKAIDIKKKNKRINWKKI